MSKMIAMVEPILPGKTEQWKKMASTLMGEKNAEYKKTRAEYGIRERVHFQQTPMGDMVIVTMEGENPGEAMMKMGQATDDFSKWFMSEVKEIHGLDLSAPPPGPMPEMIIDSGK